MWLTIAFLVVFFFGFSCGHVVCSVRRGKTILYLKHITRIAIGRLRVHENARDLNQLLEDIQ